MHAIDEAKQIVFFPPIQVRFTRQYTKYYHDYNNSSLNLANSHFSV